MVTRIYPDSLRIDLHPILADGRPMSKLERARIEQCRIADAAEALVARARAAGLVLTIESTSLHPLAMRHIGSTITVQPMLRREGDE